MGIIDKRIEKASWVHFLIWLTILIVFSVWAFGGDSPWTRAMEAAGGALPETQPGIPALEPARSFQTMGEDTQDYLLWQLLDIPFSIMNFMIISIGLGLGLKAVRAENSPLRWLMALPVAYFLSEMVEDALLAAFATQTIPTSEPLVLVQQLATTIKFSSMLPSLILAIIGIIAASLIALFRMMKKT